MVVRRTQSPVPKGTSGSGDADTMEEMHATLDELDVITGRWKMKFITSNNTNKRSIYQKMGNF